MERVAVVGGCGHVGLPLSIALARDHEVPNCYVDEASAAAVQGGHVPFREKGAEEGELLGRTLHVHSTPQVISGCAFVAVEQVKLGEI